MFILTGGAGLPPPLARTAIISRCYGSVIYCVKNILTPQFVVSDDICRLSTFYSRSTLDFFLSTLDFLLSTLDIYSRLSTFTLDSRLFTLDFYSRLFTLDFYSRLSTVTLDSRPLLSTLDPRLLDTLLFG
jgi:hypothetical protein